MDIESAVNAVNEELLQLEETDDSCRLDFTEIIPLTGDTDGSFSAECISGNCSTQVEQDGLAVVKQECDDVCYFVYALLNCSVCYCPFGYSCCVPHTFVKGALSNAAAICLPCAVARA